MWDGLFSMEIPSNWELRDGPDLIEIVPPEPVGAAHVSVLKRQRQNRPDPGEASQLVASFAEGEGIPDTSEISEWTVDDQQIAEASFDVETEVETRHWEVGARVWPERAVVFSYTDTGEQPALRKTAVKIFRSIEPD